MKTNRKYEFYIILAAIFWGMIGISVTNLTDAGISRMGIVLIRSVVAMVSLGVYLLFADRKAFAIKLKDLWCFFGTGIISLMMFNLCYFTAIEETSIAVAAVLLYTAPAFVVLMSAVLFKEKITANKVVALVAMFAGCLLVTGIFEESGSYKFLSIMIGIGSGFAYALYSIFSRFAINRGYSSKTISFYTFAFASFGSLFLTDASYIIDVMNVKIAFFSIFIGVVSCTFPYLLYTKGMEHTDNGRASILAMAEPLVAAIISIFIDGVPSVGKIIGMIIMFCAIGFMNIEPKKKA